MKKKILATGLVLSMILTGCSLNDYNEGLDDANELVSGVVGAMNDIASGASSVMQDASPTAASIADEVKNSIDVVKDSGVLDEVKENVKDSVKEAGDKATDAAKQSIKDAAKDALNGISKDALNDAASEALSTVDSSSTAGILKSAADIELTDTDGNGKNYHFYYAGDDFTAIYTTDNWKVKDSYRVHSEADMIIICQALIDEHPVRGKDMESYRTAEDMAYEWEIHNMGYAFFSNDENLRNKAKDVDFDPKDQGLTIEEFYESRTGKEFDVNVILGSG
ncbi:MAG: hypothetical protein J6I68_11670 [Butyrivibrio sp.]|uniref:hypothetical protein n=1 Tax=Butyrivibrio sp. TaxID=28121 RepID=UPI001B4F3FD4|nr:hypothetical protein [Butyrivibrio sp.]MBP3783895.1 hypothetical protein [Butyrivibrio sp.]